MLFNTCRNGHPRTKENTYIRPSGGKECRLCKTKYGILRGKPGRPIDDVQCRNGHPRTTENTYHRRDKTRECKLCANLAQAHRRKLEKMRRARIETEKDEISFCG